LGSARRNAGLRVWWLLRRPHVHGVKAVSAPGGTARTRSSSSATRTATAGSGSCPAAGSGRGEDAAAAITREIHEELGVELHELRALGEVQATGFHKVVTLHCFAARVDANALRVRWGEIEEVRWAPPDRPPQPLGKDVPAVVALP
jgi:8-oxo-dGTP pyrophosphatase MutT (NUDIX family)